MFGYLVYHGCQTRWVARRERITWLLYTNLLYITYHIPHTTLFIIYQCRSILTSYWHPIGTITSHEKQSKIFQN